MTILTAFLFEHSPWSPFLTALLSGYAEVGWDGVIYITAAGEEYLESLE
jgi:hypothetical protein